MGDEMSIASELANEIWAEHAFHVDLASLETANIRAELHDGGLIKILEAVDRGLIGRLVQAALIFSETDDELYQETAQRISTAALRLAGTSTEDLFAIIQSRLRNFPSLRTAAGSLSRRSMHQGLCKLSSLGAVVSRR